MRHPTAIDIEGFNEALKRGLAILVREPAFGELRRMMARDGYEIVCCTIAEPRIHWTKALDRTIPIDQAFVRALEDFDECVADVRSGKVHQALAVATERRIAARRRAPKLAAAALVLAVLALLVFLVI